MKTIQVKLKENSEWIELWNFSVLINNKRVETFCKDEVFDIRLIEEKECDHEDFITCNECDEPEKEEYKPSIIRHQINFPEAIKEKRKELLETQTEFGRRFGVSHASVSDWERGVSEAPYEVINFCIVADKQDLGECKDCGVLPSQTHKKECKPKIEELEILKDIPMSLPLIFADYKKLAKKINEIIKYLGFSKY